MGGFDGFDQAPEHAPDADRHAQTLALVGNRAADGVDLSVRPRSASSSVPDDIEAVARVVVSKRSRGSNRSAMPFA